MRPPDQAVGEPSAGSEGEPSAKRRSSWLDRSLGIGLGIVLGIAIVTAFVFLGSESTIDAPRISGVDTGKPGGGGGGRGGGGEKQGQPVVRVIGGAPPPSGPVTLEFTQGQQARFTVDSDISIGIEIARYGISRTVGPRRTTISFKASKTGQYPVIVSASHIGIATLRVRR